MIPLASTDEPVITISGYDLKGDAEIEMYEADEGSVIRYLVHDKDGNQINKNPDVSQFRYITSLKQNLGTEGYTNTKISLPFTETGIFYLKVKIGSISAESFVIRSNFGVLVREGDNQFIFWGQDFKTKRSVSDGVIRIMDLQDIPKELQIVSFDTEGIARADINAMADIALVQRGADRAIVPLNLKYMNRESYYKDFIPKGRPLRYFIFTDRPLYKPGDTVYFKAILRNDDDARYSIPSGEALVRIYRSSIDAKVVFEKKISISERGTIEGQYQIPEDSKVGNYQLSVNIDSQVGEADYWSHEFSSGSTSFGIEYFRKPEFFIDITAPVTELIAGDRLTFKISGTYFSGQPLIGQKVKYVVYSSDYYQYDYLTNRQKPILSDNYRYGYWTGGIVTEGNTILNKDGEAEVNLDTKVNFSVGLNKIFSIEVTTEGEVQSPAFSRKNILIYSGEYAIFRKDVGRNEKVNTTVDLPIILIPYNNNFSVSEVELKAKIQRSDWIKYDDPNQKYPVYKEVRESLPDIFTKTDSQGEANFRFTPSKTGLYTLTVEGKDSRGNLISHEFFIYVTEEGQPVYEKDKVFKDISISADKRKYFPNESVRFYIYSEIPDRDIFLSLERGRLDRFRVVHLDGKNTYVDIPLVNTDIPNIYANVSSFSDKSLNFDEINLSVSSDSKKVVINITPNSKRFGPGETVTVDILTTDVEGKPVSGDLALWAVDKAIFELSYSRLGNIFDTFWKERFNSTSRAHSLEGIFFYVPAEMGGCFVGGTKVLMADGKLKNIEDVKIGDYVLTRKSGYDSTLVKARVLKTYKAEESGYLIINGNLKVTADHIVWSNDAWKEAGSIQIGDTLLDDKGRKLKVNSIEWQTEKVSVYNLLVENYHSYFANGIWVHNDKVSARTVYKDTAYWNPSISTDSSGRAQVRFKLPDNLTTWVIAAVAATADTQVGQSTTEIVVTKDVIIRPILPNIFRKGDEVVVSALVQNFTQQDHTFEVGLEFDSGEVEQEEQNSALIKSNTMQKFHWKIKPTKENERSKLVFSAKVKDNPSLSDIVRQEIPIRAFGFEEERGESGEGTKSYNIKLAVDIDKDKSKITLYLTPNILSSLQPTMKYLINYPYGCVEQTTSRFVPAIIAKTNPDLFSDVPEDKNLDKIIQKSIELLTSQQQKDGGWTWWFRGRSDPFIVSYVIEYLLQAKKLGFKVEDEVLARAKRYLEEEFTFDPNTGQKIPYNKEESIAKNYGLILLGEKEKVKRLTDLNNISPDFLSIAVMANYLNGDKNPQSNGLIQLSSLAKTQGDVVFWEAGNKLNFGSKEASTALAIRALLLAGGDRDLVIKGAKYLIRHKNLYWSNTFAASQAVRALAEFSNTFKQLEPNYSYIVTLDGKQISQGKVTDAKQVIKEIDVPISKIRPDGSTLSVVKEGEGQIYSTLLVREFHTDKNAKAVNRGFSIKKEFVNERGLGFSFGVGDIVIVKITVKGLQAEENYGVIKDDLPAGLVPINQSFKNERFNQPDYYGYGGLVGGEVTENGIILSLYKINAGENIYTYRARVVNAGKFIVPPVSISLMYSPEISGVSEVGSIEVVEESKYIGIESIVEKSRESVRSTLNQKENLISLFLIVILTLTVLSYLFLRNGGIVKIKVFKSRLANLVKDKVKKLFRVGEHYRSEAITRRVKSDNFPGSSNDDKNSGDS